MRDEPRTCQNCKQEFTIAATDFAFYDKIKVPPPTFCHECRLQRRLVWRNERALYRRACDLCKKETLSVYDAQSSLAVYCVPCWYSDKWDPLSYGVAYDFDKPFFTQYRALFERVPRMAIAQMRSQNAPYANFIDSSRNVYLAVSVIRESEDIFYAKNVGHSSRIFDSFDVVDSEQCYENISVDKNYNCLFAQYSRNCIDSSFLYDCVNCSNCYMSSNLRNKQYYIRNKPYRKEEYLARMTTMSMGSFSELQALQKEFSKLAQASLNKYAHFTNTIEATGDDLRDAINIQHSFNSYHVENGKYLFRTLEMRDSMDTTNAGFSELFYEFISGGGHKGRMVRFCTYGLEGLDDVQYVDFCGNSSNLFGCIAVRGKKYCIFNKQYSKEEYEQLVFKVIAQMDSMPYKDQQGRTYGYGEFFPIELSPFAYNETVAQEYFPLDETTARAKGHRWKLMVERNYSNVKSASDLSDKIQEVPDTIVKDTIGCVHGGTCNEQCTSAFKIIQQELAFYRQMNLALPRLCPNCRHFNRLRQKNPLKLWHRACMCERAGHDWHTDKCSIAFETTYSPDRQEMVYCEQCYQAEVI